MNKSEIIAKIEAIDPNAKTLGLTTIKLEQLLTSLESPEFIKMKRGPLTENVAISEVKNYEYAGYAEVK